MGYCPLMLDCSIEEDTIAARLLHDEAQLNLSLLIISRDTKSRKVIGKQSMQWDTLKDVQMETVSICIVRMSFVAWA